LSQRIQTDFYPVSVWSLGCRYNVQLSKSKSLDLVLDVLEFDPSAQEKDAVSSFELREQFVIVQSFDVYLFHNSTSVFGGPRTYAHKPKTIFPKSLESGLHPIENLYRPGCVRPTGNSAN
jgi:hypothetical protein